MILANWIVRIVTCAIRDVWSQTDLGYIYFNNFLDYFGNFTQNFKGGKAWRYVKQREDLI